MILSRRELGQALFVSFFLAIFLAAGFLPTAEEFYRRFALSSGAWGELLAFPALAGLFYFSLPTRRAPEHRWGTRALWATLLVPIGIAAGFGAIWGHLHQLPSLRAAWHSPTARLGLLWTILAVPTGEELLFRGWFYNVVDRVWLRGLASATNRLPIAVWMTALAFSIWHLQNLTADRWPVVLFQSTYTFFTGLWLGYLRWKTGSLALPLAAHLAINAACFVF